MTDPANNDDLIIAWHGVDGDTRTFWTEFYPSSGSVPTTLPSGIAAGSVLDANSFAAPGLDPSARLIASVGATAPSSMQLRAVGADNTTGPGPAVPPDFLTISRPAVATINGGNAVLAWQRHDDIIAVSGQNGSQWSDAIHLAPSSYGPAVAVNNRGTYLVAFVGANNQIYGSINGGGPLPMRPQAGGMSSSDTPGLCWGEGNFWMAWKGVPNDNTIWVAGSQDGTDWSAPQQAQPSGGAILTADGPAIAIWQGGLVLAWRGVPNDESLWWSTQRVGNLAAQWQTPVAISPADNSGAGPTLGTRTVNTY